jgi:hypothetical protein
MADQLTSIGVEFSRPEMRRIFYHIHSGVQARKWGLGLLVNPDGITSFPDRFQQIVCAPYRLVRRRPLISSPVRTPGGYKEDDGRSYLVEPNELVHPSVRIRYLYGGLSLDDAGPWKCRALIDRGYHLERRDKPATEVRASRVSDATDPYLTVLGPVAPYYDTSPASSTLGTDKHSFVKVEQPSEAMLYPLSEPQAYWVWKQRNGELPELPEEHVGMWERMFIKINEELLEWQKAEKAAVCADHPKEGGLFWSTYHGIKSALADAIRRLSQSMHGAISELVDTQKSFQWRVYDAFYLVFEELRSLLLDAFHTVGSILDKPIKRFFETIYNATKLALVGKPKPPVLLVMNPRGENVYENKDFPKTYGYHDIVSWQRGDSSKKGAKR